MVGGFCVYNHLAQKVLHVAGTVGITVVIEVVHDAVEVGEELLIAAEVAAAEVFVHGAELQLLSRLKRSFKVQTLRV